MVGFGDTHFNFIVEGLVEGEEDPVAIRDEDVVEELPQFRVIEGERVLLD